jgi:hypothetical protein
MMGATKKIDRDLFVDACEIAGLDEDGFRDDYSGRGMYDATCFGIVVDRLRDAFVLFAAMGEISATLDDDECFDVAQLASKACVDDMGRGKIVYFPDYWISKPT